MISKPNTPLGGGLLHPRAGECAEAAAFEVRRNPPQHLGQVSAGAAAGVKDINVVRGQSVGDAEVVLQRPVDAGRPCSAPPRWGVYQTPSCLRRGRIEGFEEWLVEIGHRLALAKLAEEGGAVHAVQRGRGPVQHLNQTQRLQAAGVG